MKITTGWKVHVEQANERQCDATKRDGQQCTRRGSAGFGEQRFCNQHHPEWNAWFEEMQHVQAIAERAFAKAMKRSA